MSLIECEQSHGFKVPYIPTVLNGLLKTTGWFLGSLYFFFLKYRNS